jgi:hypothetical protein
VAEVFRPLKFEIAFVRKSPMIFPRMKRLSAFVILLLVLGLSGCSWSHGQKPAAKSSGIVTPDMALAAKVVSVNEVGRFVVLSFPHDQMPKLEQTMFLYRAGLKVAEVKITGPQQEDNIVADLISGSPQIGDTVRAD